MPDHTSFSPSPPEWATLERFLGGETSPEESARVEAWFREHPTSAVAVAGYREALRRDVVSPTAEEIAAIASAVAGRIDAGRTVKPSRERWNRAQLGAGVGAMLALAVMMVLTMHRAPMTTQVYQTAPGQRSTVRLVDGSTIVLAPATRVAISPSIIAVMGDVQCSISPRAARSVVVQTRNAVVRVLGTRFTVRQYQNDSVSRVSVEEGRVALQAARRVGNLVLSEQMAAVVTDSGVTLTAGTTHGYIDWTDRTLVFNHVPLREVITELGRAYAANIRIADSSLASEPIVAEVEVNKRSVTQILDVISAIVHAHYVREGSAFVLSQGRHDVSTPHNSQDSYSIKPEKDYGR